MTMTNYNHFIINEVLPDFKAQNHKNALFMMAEHAARAMSLDRRVLLKLLNAENRGGIFSGIGDGVVIHHLTLPNIDKPYILFARALQAIDYEAVDHQPVDLFCLILSPEKEGILALQRLAFISRVLRDKALCECLRGADSADALYALLYDSFAPLIKAA